MVPFHRNFNSILRRDHQKKFLTQRKKNLVHKGLNGALGSKGLNPTHNK